MSAESTAQGAPGLQARDLALEVDAAAGRLGGLPVRQAEQELQHTDGGQLRGLEPRAPAPPPRGTSPRSPRRATARPAGPAPISPTCRPGCSPARPARSEAERAHQYGGAGTTGTSTVATVGGTPRSSPSTMLPHRETPRSPTESSRYRSRIPCPITHRTSPCGGGRAHRYALCRHQPLPALRRLPAFRETAPFPEAGASGRRTVQLGRDLSEGGFSFCRDPNDSGWQKWHFSSSSCGELLDTAVRGLESNARQASAAEVA